MIMEILQMSKFSEYLTYLKVKYLKIGSVQITEFSTDGTFADNSDTALPTEKAVKTYVTAHAGELNNHALVSSSHTATSLTPGHFLKATGASTFGFAAHGLAATDVGAIANPANGASGDILYHNGTTYVRLAKGTTNQVLAASSSGFPYWKTP
jgi:hypothetical protein